MTREHKLALIVGFSILLLVGVLISDHLSRARETRIDTVTLEPAAAMEPADRSIPVDPLAPVNRAIAADAPPTRVVDPAPGAITEPPVSGSVLLADAASKATGGAEVRPVLGGDGTLEGQFVKAGGTITTGSDGVPEVRLPGTLSVQPPVSRTPDKTHVVRKNETLFGLAKQYYGDSGLWPMLAAYNKDKVGKNGSLREGQSLRIPTRAVLTGKPDPAPRPTPGVRTIAGETRVASSRTYTVKKNDTLGDVSKAVYGTSRRWRDILAANRGVIDDEDVLRVGMVLKVPG